MDQRSAALRRLRSIARTREAELDAIHAAFDAGASQKDVIEASGRSREWVRRVQRAHDELRTPAAS